MKSRAIRRHHRDRLLKRWTPIIKWMHLIKGEPSQTENEIVVRHAHLRLKTRKPCSCFLCSGWRRRIAGPTRQERLEEVKFQEELTEVQGPSSSG